MRRSISYCEPAYALAGAVNTWKFIYTTAAALPKGTRLRFDLMNKGRDIDWELPSSDLKEAKNVIYAQLDNGKVIQANEVENPNSIIPFFDFILPAGLPIGGNFTILMGAPPVKGKDSLKHGTRAQCNSQRRRTFQVFIDPTGKTRFDEPEIFTIDVRGSILHNIRILTPSFVVRNKRFDIIVRFEDEFGNLTSNTAEDTLIELSYEHLRESLKWKLFVPETGFINLPNLYFNEPGVYTIQLLNTKNKQKFRSSPIICFNENSRHLYWGLLHGESERVDSTENIENCLRHFRDDKALNFYAATPFESQDETPNETWKLISQNIAEFDEVDRFVTFLGFQWEGKSPAEGLRILLYTKDNKPILRAKDQKSNAISKVYRSSNPKELISIPSFTMGKGYSFNFEDFNPEFERVVEIYNAWGSSECTIKEGNLRPITSKAKNGIKETPEGSIRKALENNCRVGFVAGGLDDRGIYADFFESDQEQYSPGLTAIVAAEHSRTSLAEALHNRSCYATTGERIVLGISLAGAVMGSELSTSTKPGLMINRHLAGYVAGTCKLDRVELIRNGKIIETFKTDTYWLNFTYDDMVALEKVAFPAKDKKPPFVYYYIRVIQADGHMAWSSPIWVDLLPISKEALKRPTRGSASKAAAPVNMSKDDEEDEEEEEDEDLDE